ncbi:hypothetical protein DOY81_004280, partial [Sarcophaga bullata]
VFFLSLLTYLPNIQIMNLTDVIDNRSDRYMSLAKSSNIAPKELLRIPPAAAAAVALSIACSKVALAVVASVMTTASEGRPPPASTLLMVWYDLLGRPMPIFNISSITIMGGTRIITSTMPRTLILFLYLVLKHKQQLIKLFPREDRQTQQQSVKNQVELIAHKRIIQVQSSLYE